jgi:hypothetical protein
MENQNKVFEGLEKALASPDFPLAHLKAALLEQTLLHCYPGIPCTNPHFKL